jgi:hypothetical protein
VLPPLRPVGRDRAETGRVAIQAATGRLASSRFGTASPVTPNPSGLVATLAPPNARASESGTGAAMADGPGLSKKPLVSHDRSPCTTISFHHDPTATRTG